MPCSYCGKPRVIAKGLCNACYYRQKKNGTLEYKRLASPLHCKLEGCDRPVVARGYCESHYRNDLRFGNPVRTFGYGERSDHPLYESWCWQVRCAEKRVPEWNDFWAFVADVGDKPEGNVTAKRYDRRSPWGPENFYWHERIASTEDRKQYAREWRKAKAFQSKGHSLKKAYGLSLEQYMQMYEAQHGKCAICHKNGEPFDSERGRSKTLVVDHCHGTSKIRGLLCPDCNKGLGSFKDDQTLLLQALHYLRSKGVADTYIDLGK